jgi:hypothetical protein
LVADYTRGLFCEGKAKISAEVAGILQRLNTSAQNWSTRLLKLKGGCLFGRFFAAAQERLQSVARTMGVQNVANLASCEAC